MQHSATRLCVPFPSLRWEAQAKCAAILILLLMAVLLAGCGTRPTDAVLAPVALKEKPWRQVTIYAVTTRTPNEDGRGFDSGRAEDVRYMRYTLSIPRSHEPGNIEYPDRKPDPEKSFTVIAAEQISHAAFLQAIAKSRAQDKEVGVFVHGFNYTFQESLFRMAQMAADANVDGVSVLFAWPSEGELRGYIADKDSATYSRDQLTHLLDDLTRSHSGRTVVIGHSMGGWLTMEALRQLRLTGQDRALNHLSVILAAPDIDVDVFRAQLKVVGRLRTPLVLLVSPDDRALYLSSLLAGDERAGSININDPLINKAVVRANVTVVDISELTSSDGTNHDRFKELAAIYPKLKADAQVNKVQQAGVFVFNAVNNTLFSPFTAAAAATRQ
ncbi:alpha/beta hydrolase [Rhizobium sp. L1K21]|uniref:alpha/beta hydrolase n=1 Tax=Rhizobium sp. L1K21 TaxID=2954933 RepID=UPI0020938180|nr:alpha/beta fold hydrolase [Rhizobium sp. L1K21]MCO6188272.1 alpha/beta fold hydrolase [Rhizobium sp. L1K21]